MGLNFTFLTQKELSAGGCLAYSAMSGNGVREWLAQHPKMTSAVFTALLLLIQAQTVLAEGKGSAAGYAGP